MRIKLDFDDEENAFEVIQHFFAEYLKKDKEQLSSIQFKDVLDDDEVEKVLQAMEVLIDWYGVPDGD